MNEQPDLKTTLEAKRAELIGRHGQVQQELATQMTALAGAIAVVDEMLAALATDDAPAEETFGAADVAALKNAG